MSKASSSKGKLRSDIVETQLVGLARFLVSAPVEHLLDRLKTHTQSQLTHKSLLDTTRAIYRSSGVIKGLFAGFSPNLLMSILKHQYRWPMMILLPKYIKQTLKPLWPRTDRVMTGIIIGVFEAYIICPIERVKCLLMTRQNQVSRTIDLIIFFIIVETQFQSIRKCNNILRTVYGGIGITLQKQVVSWVQYLYCDHLFRHSFKEKPSDKLTISQIALCATMSGICNIVLVSPFDTLKTLYQMENNQQYIGKTIRHGFQHLYQTGGIQALYAGWRLRILTFVMQAALSTPIIDYLERTYGSH